MFANTPLQHNKLANHPYRSANTPATGAPLRSVADTLKQPAFPTAVWNLEPDQAGFLPVAEGRGGPFRISWEIHGTGPVRMIVCPPPL